MLAFIYGGNSWQVGLVVAAQRQSWQSKNPHGRVESFTLSALKYVSFFAEPRLLVLNNLLAYIEAEELLVECKRNDLSDLTELDILIAAVGERMELVKKHKGLFAWLEKNAKPLQALTMPTGERLGALIVEQLRGPRAGARPPHARPPAPTTPCRA